MSTNNINIGILGSTGRVGKLLSAELQSETAPALLAGGVCKDSSADVMSALFKEADVLIDFSSPDGLSAYLKLAVEHKKPLVIGTTGLSDEQEALIKEASESVPIVYAANMSVGVNMLLALIKKAAGMLGPEWDIEISETHHKHKIDAPSGTALAMGKAAASGRGISFEPITERSGARTEGDIGFSVQRGGDVIGEHMASFYAEGERLELGHRASSRALFAKGAIRAALWVNDQEPGLYSMQDVLNI